MGVRLSASINSRVEYKRKFSVWILFRAFIFVPGAISKLIGNKKSKLIDNQFIERIHLAITEVNGCAACAYQHSKMALREGMSNEEISSFLSGDGNYVKKEEAKAIMFAQHFADSKGIPEKFAYDSIVKEYGKKEALIILSASQLIIVGNIYGIPYSAFLSRLKGKPYKDSSIFYELGMEISGIIIVPIAILYGSLRSLLGFPNVRFTNTTKIVSS